MKTMKKLASLTLALLLVLSLAVPAFAANETTGTIKISNAVPDQTYNAYKIFDLESYGGKTDNDETAPHSYTVADGWADFFAEGAAGAAYVTIENGYVTWKTDKMDADSVKAFAAAALAYAKDKSISATATGTMLGDVKKDPAGELTLTTDGMAVANDNDKLPLGYYLIDSTLGTLCTLDTTNNNVKVTEKNDRPSDEKESTPPADGIKVGSVIPYTITINAKKGAEKYVVHDTMSKGLTFNKDIAVTATPVVAAGETATTTTLTSGTHYTVNEAPTDGCTFEVAFEQSYLDTLEKDTTIVITYTATVNANAATGEKDPVTNQEKLSYGNKNETDETPGNTTKDKLCDFDLVKTTSKNVLLEGAEFQLLNASGEVIELIRDGNTYRPALGTEEGIEKFTTGTEKLTFVGFGEGTYSLEEIKAPDGYNQLKAPIEIKIEKVMENGEPVVGTDGLYVMKLVVDGKECGFTATISEIAEPEENGPVNTITGGVHVTNYTGAELPSTGGIGTTLFYVVGGILIVGAAVLLVTKKRMSGEEQ